MNQNKIIIFLILIILVVISLDIGLLFLFPKKIKEKEPTQNNVTEIKTITCKKYIKNDNENRIKGDFLPYPVYEETDSIHINYNEKDEIINYYNTYKIKCGASKQYEQVKNIKGDFIIDKSYNDETMEVFFTTDKKEILDEAGQITTVSYQKYSEHLKSKGYTCNE